MAALQANLATAEAAGQQRQVALQEELLSCQGQLQVARTEATERQEALKAEAQTLRAQLEHTQAALQEVVSQREVAALQQEVRVL